MKARAQSKLPEKLELGAEPGLGGHVTPGLSPFTLKPWALSPCPQAARPGLHLPLPGPVAPSPELFGAWRDWRGGIGLTRAAPAPAPTPSLPLPLGAGPPFCVSNILVPVERKPHGWASWDLLVHLPQLALPTPLRPKASGSPQAPQQVELAPLSDLPVAHHLHAHQPGLGRHPLLPRPTQLLPPHRRPASALMPAAYLHLAPSHSRFLLCSDPSLVLSGVKATVHTVANKVL